LSRRGGILCGLALLYIVAFPYHPGLRSPNELCRLWQTRALFDFHRLEVNQAIRWFGPVRDLSRFEGRYYPSKAPLLSFAAVPVYAALRAWYGPDPRAVPELQLVYWSRLWLTVLPTLLLLALLLRFLSAYASAPVAEGLVVTYALGSLAFSYSLLFMSHQPTAVLVFASFFALWRCGRGEAPLFGYVVAGACLGAAVATEYTAALPAVALAGYGLLTVGVAARATAPRSRLLLQAGALFGLGALPFLAGLLAYHQACFGGPFETGYRHLADAAYQPWHQGGFLGIRWPDPRALWLSFFSPLRGLFTLAPFLVLGLIGLPRLYRREPAMFWLVALLIAAYTYFTASFSYESWGWTTGPRHLTPLIPFLLAPAALWLESMRKRQAFLPLRAAAGLCMASVLTTGALTGINYIPDDVSNGVGALALPLFRAGYFTPTVAALFSQAAWPGALWLGAVALGAALAAGLLVPHGPVTPAARLALPLVLAAQALLVAGTTRNDSADQHARQFLASVWLVHPSGEH
jgi:hypothetical protein